MSVVTIPLDKNPEVAQLVEDLQPGQKVYGCFSIKSKDEQTLQLRIAEMARTRDELPDGSEHEDDDDSPEGVEEGGKGPTDEQTGDGSDDEEREAARENAGGY